MRVNHRLQRIERTLGHLLPKVVVLTDEQRRRLDAIMARARNDPVRRAEISALHERYCAAHGIPTTCSPSEITT